MDITCPHCRQTLEGDSVSPGDDVVCPACNREFSIPRLVALGPDRSGFNSRRAQRKPQLAKRMSFAIVLVGLLVAGGVWVRNELKKHVGQLLPGEYALEGDSAERDFLADFSRRYGRGYIDVFCGTIGRRTKDCAPGRSMFRGLVSWNETNKSIAGLPGWTQAMWLPAFNSNKNDVASLMKNPLLLTGSHKNGFVSLTKNYKRSYANRTRPLLPRI